MSNKSINRTLSILTILLCLVLIGLGTYTYSFYNEIKESESQLINDKELIQAELDEEISMYNKLLQEKDQMSLQLSQAKERLEILQKRVDSNEITRSIVQKYQIEIRQLRKEREFIFKQNDSLQRETIRLSNLQERTQNSLDSITKERKTGLVESQKETTTTSTPRITISNLRAQAVIQRNSGKFVNTTRAARAQMVRFCYEVDSNPDLAISKMSFYVKVLSKNKLIGIERSIRLATGEKLSYNLETSINYKNQSHKICELVLPLQTFGKGNYEIEVYDTHDLLGATTLTLK